MADEAAVDVAQAHHTVNVPSDIPYGVPVARDRVVVVGRVVDPAPGLCCWFVADYDVLYAIPSGGV